MHDNVLITGGAGFIGSHLCESILNDDLQVYCVDNLLTGSQQNIQQLMNNPNFHFIEASIIDKPENYLPKNVIFKQIYHLASPASPVGYFNHPILTYQANAFGTHYLLEYANKTHAKMLYTSTSESYGDPLIHPQTEDYWGNVDPIGMRSCYDVSKRFGEMACTTWYRQFHTNVRVVRIFNTYGPKNDPNDGRVIPTFIMQALQNKPIVVHGDGTQTRSYCFVEDLVIGLKKMMAADVAGEVVNLGNPEEYTILNTAKKIIVKTDSSSSIVFQKPTGVRKDDPKKRRPNIDKAQRLLQWQPKISFDQGIEKTIAWYKQQFLS